MSRNVVTIGGHIYTGKHITIETLRQLAGELSAEAFRHVVRRAVVLGRLALIA